MKMSSQKTIIIELTEEEAMHLKTVVQKYRNGDVDDSYMTGNKDEDDFVNRFLYHISVEVKDAYGE